MWRKWVGPRIGYFVIRYWLAWVYLWMKFILRYLDPRIGYFVVLAWVFLGTRKGLTRLLANGNQGNKTSKEVNNNGKVY